VTVDRAGKPETARYGAVLIAVGRTPNGRVIPSVAYTDPEIAWVGVTETQAKAEGISMGCEAEDIGLTVHPHPTLSETVAFAAEACDGTLTDLYVPKKKG
jgi:pyruvate/2-oxoglutarate dehydrogenase complex dihydrolipoamide dehydrogenase (E3) component